MNPAETEEAFEDIDRVPISVLDHMSDYWRQIAERKIRQHDVSIRRILFGQLLTIIFVAASSLLIESRAEAFLLVGTTLLLYPSLTDILMSSGSVLAANIHHDLERQDESPFRYSLFALIRSIFGTICASILVGAVASSIGYFALGISFLVTMKLAIIATSIAATLGLPIILITTHVVRNHKSNPDEIVPALESSLFNVVMLFAIAIGSRFIT